METIIEIINYSSESLRGHMKFEEYRQYLITAIFYKYLSYKIEKENNKKLFKYNINFQEAFNDENTNFYGNKVKEDCINELGYFIKPENLYNNLIHEKDLYEKLNRALSEIIFQDNSYNEIFNGTDFKKLDNKTNTCDILKEILLNIDLLTFKNEHADEFNEMMQYFMKKSYTPSPISKLLGKLVSIEGKTLTNVYDAACGSCSTLLKLKENNEVINYYGQELKKSTYDMARINLLSHDIHPVNIHLFNEDSMTSKRELPMMDAVVSHPPFLKKWDADIELLEEERFNSYKKLPPKSKADYAFIETMIYQLKNDGLMAVAIPQGVLFRSNAEKEIRKNFILNNYIDSVIALPEKSFSKNIPTCVIVFRKNRSSDDKILFIDASKDFKKSSTLNILRDSDIEKITKTYAEKLVVDKYSYFASIDEIVSNDYNLNIKLYVNSYEQKDRIDIKSTLNKINKLESSINSLNIKQKDLIDFLLKNK